MITTDTWYGVKFSRVVIRDASRPDLQPVGLYYVAGHGLYGLVQQDSPNSKPHVVLLTPEILKEVVKIVSDPALIRAAEGKLYVN